MGDEGVSHVARGRTRGRVCRSRFELQRHAQRAFEERALGVSGQERSRLRSVLADESVTNQPGASSDGSTLQRAAAADENFASAVVRASSTMTGRAPLRRIGVGREIAAMSPAALRRAMMMGEETP